jgi:hypothetical protein
MASFERELHNACAPQLLLPLFSGAATCRLLGLKAEIESELMNSITFEENLVDSLELLGHLRTKRLKLLIFFIR